MTIDAVDTLSELDKLVEICHINLENSKVPAKYLIRQRKIDIKDIVKYKLGFFPQNIDMLIKHVNRDVLLDNKIIDYVGSSKFSTTHGIIFPIHDEYGSAVGISGRTLLDNDQRSLLGLAKYEGSSYKKSRYLYGLNYARGFILKKQNCYIVEGNIDQIVLSKYGMKNSVAICGTAFSKNHFIKLARYTEKMTFILDRDDGGIKSMERIYSKYSNKGVKLRFMLIPNGYKDADEYFLNPNNTRESFLKDLENYIPNWP